MKPYRTIPIRECGEPLSPIPAQDFAFFDPHPYASQGAPYGKTSPWMLREGVLEALQRARKTLQKHQPGWKIKVFDALRPNAVQAFMVENEFRAMALKAGLDPLTITATNREKLAPQVYRIWGLPSDDPATPPLHSTGGALDVTLEDEKGTELNMGSVIDENSERSVPDYYQNASDELGQTIHRNRTLLHDILRAEGFHRHHIEWWHYSRGDQYWAWRERKDGIDPEAVAIYGRSDLLQG